MSLGLLIARSDKKTFGNDPDLNLKIIRESEEG
jgi:hypothetical protein